jgi:uncharacterized protein
MKDNLAVFRGLPIPIDYAATMKYAVLAKSNGGKTYLTLKMEEQLCDAGAFFVTLDPVGKHWALRVGKDGKRRGGKHDVYVLGGLHGDVPLEPGSGALIADTVLDHPGRYVLDVSQFETDADQDRFATDFARRLFRRKAKNPGVPLLLILEEAESFIPQQPRPNQAQMLGAFGRIARQGRNHGLGLWMVAQRSAALNKGVLSQADVLIAKEMSHKRDRGAVDDWVESNGTKEQREVLMGSLASLKQNEAWVWSPGWLDAFEKVVVLPRVTFDSSANVKHGEAVQDVEMTPLNVAELGKQIAATAERAKADDPRELRKRIADLEREAAQMQRDGTQAGGALEDVLAAFGWDGKPKGRRALVEWAQARAAERTEVAVPTLPEGHVDELERTRNHVRLAVIGPLSDAVAQLQRADGRLATLITTAKSLDGQKRPDRAATRVLTSSAGVPKSPPPRATPPPSATPPPDNGVPNELVLGKAHRAILTVLAQHPEGRTKPQLALQTGYSAGSGHFDNTLGKLRGAGYITRGTPILATAEGLAELGPVEPLPNGQELLSYWCHETGKAGELVLRALEAEGPMAKAELAERTGYSGGSGHFDNTLGKLRKLGLITRGQPVALAPEFEEAIR